MTIDAAQPSGSTPVPANRGSSVRTFAAAALLTFSAGLLVMIGYLILGNFFGGLLGAVGAVFAVLWWRSVHDKVFPKVVPAKSVIVLAVATAALFVLTLVLS